MTRIVASSPASVSTDVVLTRAAAGLPCWVRTSRGQRHLLPVARWIGGDAATVTDRCADAMMLDGCDGPTLDLGCGPGRLTASLVAEGVDALGVDISSTAVRMTIARGGLALHRDIFAPLPHTGHWGYVLLADGNIGIGGDPVQVLRRARDLLDRHGTLVAEVESHRSIGFRYEFHRWETDTLVGEWFAWARVGVTTIGDIAYAARLRVVDVRTHADRSFARLEWL